MDSARPGWRERAAKRKSPWNLLQLFLSITLTGTVGAAIFFALWGFHILIYPEHSLFISTEKDVPLFSIISGTLMFLPIPFMAIPVAGLLTNAITHRIPAARKALDAEAEGDPEATFEGANAGLTKFARYAFTIGITLAIIGAATLKNI